MFMDDYNSFLAQFISNFARMIQNERLAASRSINLGEDANWLGAQQHRQLLEQARDLLIANPYIAYNGKDYVCENPFKPDQGVEVTPVRLRAMARDAATLADLAIGLTNQTQWWYDPAAPEGITSHFPGQPDNSSLV